jgi:hypothetical protein
MESCTFAQLFTSPASLSGAGVTSEHPVLLLDHPALRGDHSNFSSASKGNFSLSSFPSDNQIVRWNPLKWTGSHGSYAWAATGTGSGSYCWAATGIGSGSCCWAVIGTGSGSKYNETRGSGGFLTTRNPCLSPAFGSGFGGGGVSIKGDSWAPSGPWEMAGPSPSLPFFPF